MVPEPLHPALVHFPIALAVILPIVGIASLVLIRRGLPPRQSWIWVVVVAALLFGSSWVAVRTGEAQEERVEQFVPETSIHEHEEAAELFLILGGFSVFLFAAGLANGRLGLGARYAATGFAFVLVAAGYRVGDLGGELVYRHGAAQAYAEDNIAGSAPGYDSEGSHLEDGGREEEDDRDDEQR